MIKNKLDFKLVNTLLICLITYLVCKSSNYWLSFLNRCIDLILPIFLGFFLACILNPCINYIERHKINRIIGVFIMLIIIFAIIASVLIFILPFLYKQLMACILYIISNYEIDILNKLLSHISFGVINKSIDFVTKIIIMIVSCIYFLIDMPRIENILKKYIEKTKYKIYFNNVNIEMKKYIKGFFTIIVISFFEYTILYSLIGHPYVILLGILSSLSNFIPCFGGLIIQMFSVLLSLCINKKLGIIVLILTIVFGFIDTYVINPLVYGKSNQIHPLVTIISIFIFGNLFGFIGVILSLPISIIIMTSLRFYFHKN